MILAPAPDVCEARDGIGGGTLMAGKDFDLTIQRMVDRYLGGALVRGLAPWYSSPPGFAGSPAHPDRVLLIKLHGIGNIVLLIPAIRAIRDSWPTAEIDLLTLTSNAGVAAGVKELDRRFLLDKTTVRSFCRSALATLPKLRSRRYDQAIDFEQFANASAILAALSGARERVGFWNPAHCRDRLYTARAAYVDTAHMSRLFLKVARAAGSEAVRIPPRRLDLESSAIREACVLEEGAAIRPEDVLVVVHPGSSAHLTLRRWPPERFAELADRLIDRFRVRVVLTGSEGERPLAAGIARVMRHPVTVAAGRLTIGGFAALCERAEIVVSNDTAAVHIASAMDTPVVGLYGPNTPFLYGPLGEHDLVFYHETPCSPCLVNINAKLTRCRRALCLEAITAEEVAAAIGRQYFTSEGTIRGGFKKRRTAQPVGAAEMTPTPLPIAGKCAGS